MQHFKYASIGKRLISFTIDDITVSFLFIAIFYNQITTLGSVNDMLMFISSNSWVLLMLKILYHGVFIGLNGMTLGKYIVKIKAVREDGSNLGFAYSFLRAIFRTMGEMLFYFTFIFAFFDDRNQTLHDKIAKCVVIDVSN